MQTEIEFVLENFPWFPQKNNYREPEKTCDASCCCMCLEYLKPGTINDTTEYLRRMFEITDQKQYDVISRYWFNAQTKVLLSYGIKSKFVYKLTFDDLDKYLINKKPIIIGIHHKGTIDKPTGGHLCVVIGKTKNSDYIINDPFGNLNDEYVGESDKGRYVVYTKYTLEKRWCPLGNDGWGRIFE